MSSLLNRKLDKCNIHRFKITDLIKATGTLLSVFFKLQKKGIYIFN